MPYGDNDWLALTQEPTLEPDLPICDPHHHFWDFRTVRIPFQRYLLHELTADVNSGHISQSICKRCQEVRQFENSVDRSMWVSNRRDISEGS